MMNNDIYMNDIKNVILNKSIKYDKFSNTNILVTGATGLIGSTLINTLVTANREYNLNCNIYALVRNVDKAKNMFGMDTNINYIVGDIRNKIDINCDIDYIIHAASDTSSQNFINNSTEVIDIIFNGTKNILETAKNNNAKRVIFLSTMEVYGTPDNDKKITEEHSTNLQTSDVRSCYTISKRMSENLCFCYAKMYDFNVDVLRLTQTFGPGVRYDDKRVFAEFARCAIEGKDIVLHTKGETKRSYLYTADAISAILTVLSSDVSNEIYNVANEDTYCSIYDMAKMVAEKCSKDQIKVLVELEDINKYGFAKTLHMNLDTKKIQQLGWIPTTNLEGMYKKLIKTMK